MVDDHIYLIDLKPGGVVGTLCSYVLKGERVGIIDPGPTATVENLLEGLNEIGVVLEKVAYVAATHIHLDHAGGGWRLLQSLPNAKFLVHSRGAKHMIDPTRLWEAAKRAMGSVAEAYGEVKPMPSERVVVASDDMTLDLGGGVELQVLETPGHASHEMSFYDGQNRGVFVGDAAGLYLKPLDLVLPAAPPPFYMDEALRSLERLIALKPERIYYSHFGAADKAEERLRSYRRQLEFWAETAASGIEEGLDLSEMYERLKAADEALKEADEFLQSHSFYQDNVFYSVQGFLSYLKKRGSSGSM